MAGLTVTAVETEAAGEGATAFRVHFQGHPRPLVCWRHSGRVPYWERSQDFIKALDEYTPELLRLLHSVHEGCSPTMPLDLEAWSTSSH